ncbi:hypothetical protein L249_6910 [Ophiocordyceps polyrhachis-furcata BCC 54312]|uniref:Uncharacterized protein n=1 Tax=Ophiocordyceps polyrhachis-furcata BCC 54312 TaxID=1330021 RepID=A0A367LK27_9HYPO|nr:hypothetical protein L249_6910 [Ophiocordyceps polyrhachis-furcata BCC 54312]
MQPNELASLLSRTLTFNNNSPDQQQQLASSSSSPSSSSSHFPSQRVVPSFSVSQHYNHSAHHHQQQQQQQQQQAEDNKTTLVLGSFGIDANVLTPSQLRLFGVADDAQKLRLMELWTICPPARPHDIPALAWSSNTVEQEELLAHLRSDGSQQQQQQHHHHQDNFANSVMSLDGTPPYMLSGYEELMRRERQRDAYTPATDPIYRGPDLTRHQQHMHMAMQYGAAEHFRIAPETDAMDVM